MKSDCKSVYLWRFLDDCQPRVQAKLLPHTQDRLHLHNAQMRKDFHKARSEPGISAARAGGGIK